MIFYINFFHGLLNVQVLEIEFVSLLQAHFFDISTVNYNETLLCFRPLQRIFSFAENKYVRAGILSTKLNEILLYDKLLLIEIFTQSRAWDLTSFWYPCLVIVYFVYVLYFIEK